MMKVWMAGTTDVGKMREDNQDTFSIVEHMGLCLVCDGMGGTREGKAVAESAAKGIPMLLYETLRADPLMDVSKAKTAVRNVVVKANNDLLAWGSSDRNLEGSGSTLVMIWLVGDSALLAHLGDSRIYRLRDGQLKQMTQDHTLAAMLLRMGRIDEETAKTHPGRNRLTRYIGVRPTVPPDIQAVKVKEGDVFLLCSDGLWGVVPPEKIQQIIEKETRSEIEVETDPTTKALSDQTQGLQSACNRLIEAANEGGGHDNITALLVKIGPRQTGEEPTGISESFEMR
jgi:PPM family protein phosphatase